MCLWFASFYRSFQILYSYNTCDPVDAQNFATAIDPLETLDLAEHTDPGHIIDPEEWQVPRNLQFFFNPAEPYSLSEHSWFCTSLVNVSFLDIL